MMKRAILSDLKRWKDGAGRKPLLLYGARQVGKTHVLKAFGDTCFSNIHYINFEEQPDNALIFNEGLRPQQIIQNIQAKTRTPVDVAHDIIVFDEIQECDAALTSLKYFAEDMPALAICGAGSRLGLSLNNASFPVGKVDTLKLYPLSFREFVDATAPHLAPALELDVNVFPKISEIEHRQLWDVLKNYYVVGGLPEIVDLFRVEQKEDRIAAFGQVRRLQHALLTGYMSDFSKHAGKENAAHIHRVFEQVPIQLQSVLDGSVKRFKFKGVIPSRSRYADLAGPIDWLVRAGLVYKCHQTNTPQIPLKAYTKKNLFKLFLFDVGLLGAMLDLPINAIIQQDYGSYKGWVAENYVAQALTQSGVSTLVAWQRNQAEMEFIIQQGDQVVPIEVKSGNRIRSKSLSAYRQRYAPAHSVRISPKGLAIHLPDPVREDSASETLIDCPLYFSGDIKRVVNHSMTLT